MKTEKTDNSQSFYVLRVFTSREFRGFGTFLAGENMGKQMIKGVNR